MLLDHYGPEACTPKALRRHSRTDRVEMMEYYVTHGFKGGNLRDDYSYWQGDKLVVLSESDFGERYENTYEESDLLAWFSEALVEFRLAIKEHRIVSTYRNPDRPYTWPDALCDVEEDHQGQSIHM